MALEIQRGQQVPPLHLLNLDGDDEAHRRSGSRGRSPGGTPPSVRSSRSAASVASSAMATPGVPPLPPIPRAILCPLDRRIIVDPVEAADGVIYERENIVSWFRAGNVTSPVTKERLSSQELRPSDAMQNMIEEYLNLREVAQAQQDEWKEYVVWREQKFAMKAAQKKMMIHDLRSALALSERRYKVLAREKDEMMGMPSPGLAPMPIAPPSATLSAPAGRISGGSVSADGSTSSPELPPWTPGRAPPTAKVDPVASTRRRKGVLGCFPAHGRRAGGA
mmetsp:Transcript_101965/g.263532  ORF Transcript_101965/g.263532 Transcript_101965/m.263532 type:complete len:278 (+) Transcript_101965:61-894(+)